MKFFSIAGCINAVLAVVLGAFGAHALRTRLSNELLSAFQTGVQYHFYHALGLFAVAFVASQYPDTTLVKWSGWLMLTGIVLFSGSLYVLSLSGVRGFGAITPFGGVAFITAWILLTVAIAKA
ncbi:MAG: DUF423 domain-containing protein [Gammaproteobacteria bacterium]|nr:DUF423 domain-containing protein [Gammaproteobacteria bacterium]